MIGNLLNHVLNATGEVQHDQGENTTFCALWAWEVSRDHHMQAALALVLPFAHTGGPPQQ